MKRYQALSAVAAATFLLQGCASSGPSPLPQGSAAYEIIPERGEQAAQRDVIGPGDHLTIRVFGEPELSGDDYVVDSAGYIQMPLLGEVIVAGQTTRELSADLVRRLNSRFVRNASVAVSLGERPQATFTVEGDVNGPGVFTAYPTSTLLSAMAVARSPTKTAKTSDVIIFRTINGQRAGARFDLNAIRRGRAGDPQVMAGDTIVVVNSVAKSAWRDTLAALPLLNTFVLLRQD